MLSRDQALFDQFTQYILQNEPHRKPKLFHNPQELQPIEECLKKCDIMLCDLRHDLSALDIAGRLHESAPTQMLVFGLSNGSPLHTEMHSFPFSFRFVDIVAIRDGWKGIWRQITTSKHIWNTPQIICNIEEVPVGDILQMISVGRWNSIVEIEGRSAGHSTNAGGSAERFRGSITFRNGVPRAAWSTFHIGISAVYDILSVKNGILRVLRSSKEPFLINIQRDMEEILVSYAFSLDERNSQPLLCHEIGDTSELLKSDNCRPALLPLAPGLADNENGEPAADHTSSVLNRWWSQGVGELCKKLTDAEPRSLPLRWMKPDDLENLSTSSAGAEFLVFRAESQFLVPMLGLCARDFMVEKLNEGWIPILRLGRSQGTPLYMACLDIPNPCSALNLFPCTIHVPDKKTDTVVKAIETAGHPARIFLVSDAEQEQLMTLVRENHSPCISRSIAAPVLRWDSIVSTLKKILELLSDSALGNPR